MFFDMMRLALAGVLALMTIGLLLISVIMRYRDPDASIALFVSAIGTLSGSMMFAVVEI